jgi:methylmalonyl-CoA mutase C-terminal domain/subunit
MPSKERKIKVVMATLGLETHWRGAITVASMLQNQEMDVIYLGNAYPKEIIEVAIQEDADAVGISSLLGAHLTLGGELLQMAKQKGIKDAMVFIIGGVIPPSDVLKLKELGFSGIFGPGAREEEISGFIKNEVFAKSRKNMIMEDRNYDK